MRWSKKNNVKRQRRMKRNKQTKTRLNGEKNARIIKNMNIVYLIKGDAFQMSLGFHAYSVDFNTKKEQHSDDDEQFPRNTLNYAV